MAPYSRSYNNTIHDANHYYLITILTRRVPLVEQELLPFRSTHVHPRFLVGFALVNL